MNTLLARILRFGWLGSIILTLVAVAALAVAIAMTVATTKPPETTATTVARQPAAVSVSVTTIARVLPTDRSHLPATEHQFIAVSVQLTNAGSQAVDYRVNDFMLRDRGDTTFTPDPAGSSLVGTAALPLHGTLEPGARRSGAIVFQVPMSDHTATLWWQPAADSTGGSTSWTIVI